MASSRSSQNAAWTRFYSVLHWMALIPSRPSHPTFGEHSTLERGLHFSPLVATRLPAPSHLVITPQAISSTASLISHFPVFFRGGLDFDHIWLGKRRSPSDVPRSGLSSVDAGFVHAGRAAVGESLFTLPGDAAESSNPTGTHVTVAAFP